jgi:hypothetical protein
MDEEEEGGGGGGAIKRPKFTPAARFCVTHLKDVSPVIEKGREVVLAFVQPATVAVQFRFLTPIFDLDLPVYLLLVS